MDDRADRMTRRGILAALAASIGALALSGCDLLFESNVQTTRYKITVEVQTPQGVRTGFAVRELTTSVNHGANGLSASARGRGEAVAIDLGDGKVLFALLRGVSLAEEHGALLAITARRAKKAAGYFGSPVAEIYPNIPEWDGKGPRHKPTDFLPILVTLRDLADPRSLEKVDAGNLATVFGPGVALKRITVEPSGETVTDTLQRYLPEAFWNRWDQITSEEMKKRGWFHGAYFSSLLRQLNKVDFKEETK